MYVQGQVPTSFIIAISLFAHYVFTFSDIIGTYSGQKLKMSAFLTKSSISQDRDISFISRSALLQYLGKTFMLHINILLQIKEKGLDLRSILTFLEKFCIVLLICKIPNSELMQFKNVNEV